MVTFITIGVVGVLLFVTVALTDDFHFGFDDDHTPWSMRVLALFLCACGATGYLAMFNGHSAVIAALEGTAMGLLVGYLGWKLGHAFERQAGNSITNSTALVGKRAVVSEAIVAGQFGQVQTTDEFGHALYVTATSARPHLSGAVVTIKHVFGTSVEVE